MARAFHSRLIHQFGALCLFLALGALGAIAATAADIPPPTLVADTMVINADTTITAEGAVEVMFQGSRLTARRITYDKTTNRLQIDGPMTLTDAGGTVILAESADLSADMREGIIKSARMVLNDKLQIAAQQMLRTDGRYNQLSRVTASSCQVCASNPRPLWEIRASRVVHDQLEHQLYYDNAQFRVAGVPVFYLPRLRMPDPTVSRATGFLLPSLRTSSRLGTGLKLPYFIALGPSRDLLLTPYLSSKSNTLMMRYREALAHGAIEVSGAVSRDPVVPGKTRGYFFGSGRFVLPQGFLAGFKIETVTDRSYLLDYGISEKDRLASGVWLSRIKRDSYFDARVFRYNSLRLRDNNQTQPTLISDLHYIRRMTPDLIGGQATLRLDLNGYERRSIVPFDANGDGISDGRDVARASFGVDWRGKSVLPNGMILGGGAAISADFYSIAQDQSFPATVTRVTPTASIDLAWPFVRAAPAGAATQTLEPMVQLVWSRAPNQNVPNEDSTLVEFDEGNLFSYSRFPGSDLYESGLRANIGLTWSRFAPSGNSVRVTGGRVLRAKNLGQFSTGSRLSGTRSDWLLATQFNTADGLSFTNRALFDDAFSFSKDELRLGWSQDRYNLSANYVWLVADPAEGRPVATSEMAFDSSVQISDGWHLLTSGRYNFLTERATRAGVGFEYRNECAAIDISLSRRFTSSTTVRPDTEFGFSVRLAGFGNGSNGGNYRKTCGR